MTKAEIIQGIKDAWSKALMDEKDLHEDVADSYVSWVLGLVESAAPELQGTPAGSNQGGDEAAGAEAGADGMGGGAGAQGGMM